MAGLALGLFVMWFLVVFVARTLMQKRATGDSGVRTGALPAPTGSIDWIAGWMLVLALLAGVMTGGAFALVRNPIYTAMFVTAIGLVLMVPNWVAVAGFVLLVASVELQVRCVEEPHLRRLHGSEYAAYESRVGRFVPGIGRRGRKPSENLVPNGDALFEP